LAHFPSFTFAAFRAIRGNGIVPATQGVRMFAVLRRDDGNREGDCTWVERRITS